jgi:hypothetical protein
MVEDTFGYEWCEGVWEDEEPAKQAERRARGEGRLLGVWTRENLGLTKAQYGEWFARVACPCEPRELD